MIFVTVGTHEQQFNRLVKAVDDLKIDKKISEPVFIQTGYSSYTPKKCAFKKFLSIDEMHEYMKRADVIITHGGPSSFIMALQYNKIPLVVPRLEKYHEHVNNHQFNFCEELVTRNFPIKLVEDTQLLAQEIAKIENSETQKKIQTNNDIFVEKFGQIVSKLLGA